MVQEQPLGQGRAAWRHQEVWHQLAWHRRALRQRLAVLPRLWEDLEAWLQHQVVSAAPLAPSALHFRSVPGGQRISMPARRLRTLVQYS